jgi:hypothetical protein
MSRRVLALCAVVTLAGCLVNPPIAQLPPGAPIPMIRLFGKEIPADQKAIHDEVLRVIAPGMPMQQASAAISEQLPEQKHAYEFVPAEFYRRLHSRRHVWPPEDHVVASSTVVGEWGRRYGVVAIILIPDLARMVKSIDVMVELYQHEGKSLFEARPDLQEPLGLTISQAQGVMEAAGFACVAVRPGVVQTEGRPYLFCWANADKTQPGRVLGVRLFADEAGVVRATEILRKPVPLIRLLGTELPSDNGVIREALLRVIPPDSPRERAEALLRADGLEGTTLGETGELGFTTQYKKQRPGDPLPDKVFGARRPVFHEWGKNARAVVVFLIPGSGDTVKDVKVEGGYGSWFEHEDTQHFFTAHPDLAEPVGLPVAEAEARMRAAGFCCTHESGDQRGGRGQEHLLCEARDDRILLGSMVRVRLFYDQTGVIRDSAFVREGRWFDAERAMLPSADDSVGEYAYRAALFPARVTARYSLFATLIVVGVTLRLMTPGGGP